MEQKRSLKGIVVVIAILLMMIIVLIRAHRLSKNAVFVSLSGGKGIAVVEINDVIMSSEKIIEKLRKVEKENYEAIILRIDSPGGAAAPCQEIYEEVSRIDAKIPVYSSVANSATSGAYYIAAATRRIYANAGSLIGSIGVIMQTMDLSKLYEFLKISPEVIAAGKYKDAGGVHRKMTLEERKLFSDVLKSVHQQFIRDVAKKREEKLTVDIKEITEGQIFTGEMGLELGLIDRISNLYSAGMEIFNDLELKGEFELKFIRDKKEISWPSFMDYFKGLVSRMNSSVLMYL